jgi:NAD+ kinase
MRILIYGSHPEEVRPLAETLGFEVVTENPDVVISHGGDGTLLGSEREWPDVPKVAIRRTKVSKKCAKHADLLVLERVLRGEASRTALIKLAGEKDAQKRVAVNDIILHNENVTSAVRYHVRINGVPYSGEIIGDGLVVSTPFGSTAYYRSVTQSFFRVGIGLAFNNSTERISHLVLQDTVEIEVVITRGPALLNADNHPHPITLQSGDRATIRRDSGCATILAIDTILCPDCHRISKEPFQISTRLPFP